MVRIILNRKIARVSRKHSIKRCWRRQLSCLWVWKVKRKLHRLLLAQERRDALPNPSVNLLRKVELLKTSALANQ